jgi:cardiolipin synthase
VQVRRFHRWRWRQPWRYNRRNHRKLLVVDEARLYVGGFNLHRQSS